MKEKTNIKKAYGGYVIKEGCKFTIIAAIKENGNSPFFEYYTELMRRIKEKTGNEIIVKKRDNDDKEYNMLQNYFNKFCSKGNWSNKMQLRAFKGNNCNGFYEFKYNETGLRVPFFYDPCNRAVVVLCHYFNKRSQVTPKSQIEKMIEIKKSFLRGRNQK